MANRSTPDPHEGDSRAPAANDGSELDSSAARPARPAELPIGREPDDELSEDFNVDRIVDAGEAGLGGGLDQAEEARAGITDEELAEKARRTKR